MIHLLADASLPTTQPAVAVCNGGQIFSLGGALSINACDLNYVTVISSIVAMTITIVLGLFVARRLSSRRPGKMQMIFEFLLAYVKDLIKESVGDEGDFIIPIAATIGIYILIANWLDFFPLTRPIVPANADVNQTFAMAMVVILIVQAYSFKVLGFRGYFYKFTKPFELSWAIRVAFIPLNIVEELVKPITLALRLFGNIFAGLVMVEVLANLPSFLSLVPQSAWPWGGFPLVAAWKLFDVLFIGAIQAFIFCLLTIIYFGMAREGLEEEHHHGSQAVVQAA